VIDKLIDIAKWILGAGLIAYCILIAVAFAIMGVAVIWVKAHEDATAQNRRSKNWHVLVRTGAYIVIVFVALTILGATTRWIDAFLGWAGTESSSFVYVMMGYGMLGVGLYDSKLGKWLRRPANPGIDPDDRNQDAA